MIADDKLCEWVRIPVDQLRDVEAARAWLLDIAADLDGLTGARWIADIIREKADRP